MSRYEVLMLAVPEITQDEIAALESQLQGVVKKNNAVVLSFERWGKYRLAYPVKKNEYGVYFLTRFETEMLPAVLLDAIKAFLAVDQRNIVMRYTLSALDPKGSLEYRRPPSLEETPPKEVGSFVREGRGREGGGRGGRGGFSRGPRGPRQEGDFGGRRGEYSRPVETDEEVDMGHDIHSEEVQ